MTRYFLYVTFSNLIIHALGKRCGEWGAVRGRYFIVGVRLIASTQRAARMPPLQTVTVFVGGMQA